MNIFVCTKFVGEYIDQNFEIISALTKVFDQICRYQIQISSFELKI